MAGGSRNHPSYWAFVAHRVSGLALVLFLPVHFWALSRVLRGEAALDGFLHWTEHPLIRASEIALVGLLALHLTGGLRVLMIEFAPWRAPYQTLVAVSAGLALAVGLAFALNLA